jgi:uncharacterized protein (TIGR03435 family)
MRIRLTLDVQMRVLSSCLMVATAWSVWGQEGVGELRFEAASVRLHTAASPSTGRSGIEETPGLVRVENLSLHALIASAFGVRTSQIDGPKWLDDVSVDISAKPPSGFNHGQLQPLLRNLLIERFKLATHEESKETPGFALVIAKGGPKLHEAMQPRGYFTARPGLIEEVRATMPELAGALGRVLGLPVVDKTGLTMAFEIKVEWTPDQMALTGPDEKQGPTEQGLSLFAAVQEQLGLRLQVQKVPVDVVFIDHMERVPAEN